jgi:plastocyanin
MTSFSNPARTAAAVLAVSGLLAACGSSSSSSAASSKTTAAPASSAAAGAATGARSGLVKVAIAGFAFKPATITVTVGTKVTFTNHDQTAHTATSTKPGFDTGTVKPGASATVTLKKPGTYTYFCQFHAFMRGTIVVR